jgi:hypothetical protein
MSRALDTNFEVHMKNYYDNIKRLAKERGCKVSDLFALAPQNDPFYMGTPGQKQNAEWFAELWERFDYSEGVHLRRVHYQLISQASPVTTPNGKPYENTEDCWNFIGDAGKAARYLKLVDPAAFVDRRNPEPYIFTVDEETAPEIEIENTLAETVPEIPPCPDVPCYTLGGFNREQPYHLEIWCEKSTQNDIIIPLCEKFGVNLVTGLGELSITSTLAVVRRIADRDKPARILYVSDFDPAGQCMPVSVSRKIEYFICDLQLEGTDVELFPLILTAEQVEEYDLPRTPIKPKERRRGMFEARHGTGAVELDALQALHPGELARVLRQAITSYFDVSLGERVYAAESRWINRLGEIQSEVYAAHREEINALKEEYGRLRSDFTERMESVTSRISALWSTIEEELQDEMPAISATDVPEAEDADGLEVDALFDSSREYMTQLRYYKSYQGKAA